MIVLKLTGVVVEDETQIPLGGLLVDAQDGGTGQSLGRSTTDRRGAYTLDVDVRTVLKAGCFLLRLVDRDTGLVLTQQDVVLDVICSAGTVCDVRIPRDDLGARAPQRQVAFVGDAGDILSEAEIGEVLRLRATGLKPATAHDVDLSTDDGTLLAIRVMSDAFGRIGDALLWPLVGMTDPRSGAAVGPLPAAAQWGGRTLELWISHKGTRVGYAKIKIARGSTRPIIVAMGKDGTPQGAVQPGSEVIVGGQNFQPSKPLRVFLIKGRDGWRPGDRFSEVLRADLCTGSDGAFRTAINAPRTVPPGAYDILVRPLTYGLEDDELAVVRAEDVVTYRSMSGLTVLAEPSVVRHGGLRLVSLAGRQSGQVRPTRVFCPGDDIWVSVDQVPAKTAVTAYDLFLIDQKSAATWRADKSLTHLGGNGAAPRVLGRSGGAGWHLLWPDVQPGRYEVIAKPVLSGTAGDPVFDQSTDFIDGYSSGGIRVVPDPLDVADFEYCGVFSYEDGTETVLDEAIAYDVYAGEAEQLVEVTMPVQGIVYFPADVDGATEADQISTAQDAYPIFVIVHGANNSQESYLGYAYLLEAAAKQGFVAVSIVSGLATDARARADIVFHNLDRIKAMFGARVEDRVVVAGHSRGGEAAVQVAQLSLNPAIDHTIAAVIAIAPTDNYGRKILGEAAARPFMVLYGSHDGDVVGSDRGDVTRQTGFSLYDRAYGAPKTMVFVHNALHGPFNTVWGTVDSTSLYGTDVQSTIDEAAHRIVAQAYITAFLRYHVLGEAGYEGVVKGDWIPASVQAANEGDMTLGIQYRGLDEDIVDAMIGNPGADGWQTSTNGGTVTDDGTLPADPTEDWLHQIDPNSPHETGAFRLRWNGTGDRLVFSLPGPLDVEDFGYVSFRVGQVVDTDANPGGAQDFYVGLRDQGGATRQVRVGAFAEIPAPVPRTDNPPDQINIAKSAMRTIRLPLTAFTIDIDGMPAVNLGAVVEVAFRFAEVASGEIVLDTVAFADTALPTGGVVSPGVQDFTSELTTNGSALPGLPTGPSAIEDLLWEAREVIRQIDGAMRVLTRVLLPGIVFEARALAPFVRIGDRAAIWVAPGPNGKGVAAYFDVAPPDGGTIDYGFADRGQVRRLRRTFDQARIERLDRQKLPPGVTWRT